MKNFGIILFCSVILSSALAGLDFSNNKNSEDVSSRRSKRSVIFFPAGSSDEDEEEESAFISFALNPFENSLYDLINKDAADANLTNLHDQRLSETLRLLEEAMAEDVMERSLAGGGGNAKNRRKPQISIIAAAINALNPITYMRGSFNGFRNALIQNMLPFKRRFGINRKDSKTTKLTTETTTTVSPSTQPTLVDPHQEAATNIASASVSSPSATLDGKGLDLKIPPELINYAALEVNLKPNGDINIVPVTTGPVLNKKSNDPQQNKNSGGGSNSGSSSSSNNNILNDSQESSSNSFSTNNFNNNANNLGNNFGQNANHVGGGFLGNNLFSSNNGIVSNNNNANNNIANLQKTLGLKNTNLPNVVKLVTDRPVIVESIQDIIGSDNAIRNSHINNLLSKSPIPVDFTNLFNNPSVDPNAQLRFPSGNDQSPDHIYLLPFRINHNRDIFSSLQSPPPYASNSYSKTLNNHIAKNDVDASEIYYIDITIPDKQNSKPIVSHKRYPAPKKYRRRTKRSDSSAFKIEKDKEKTERSDQFLDYDGWQPLDNADPMSDVTLVYKPPFLERVHFGKDPPKEKPLYPVLPVNPPVYVIRAEPAKKEIHAVYGTENVAYLHVNPKTNSAKAYSAFGKNRFDTKNEVDKNTPPKREKSNSTLSLSDILKGVKNNRTDSDIKSKPDDDNIDTINLETQNSASSLESISQVPKSNSDFGSFEKILKNGTDPSDSKQSKPNTFEESSKIPLSKILNLSQKLAEVLGFSENLKTSESTSSKNLPQTLRSEFMVNRKVPKSEFSETQSKIHESEFPESASQTSESEFSEKSLNIEDDYYYYTYDEQDESNAASGNDTDTPSTTSDPFASIIPKHPNAHSYKEKGRKSAISLNEDDPYLAEGSELYERRVNSDRASLHELLKNFGGAQVDRYIVSASENTEQSYTDDKPEKPKSFKSSQKLSRSRQTLPHKPQIATGRKITSPKTDINNNRDWYLIETRAKPAKSLDSVRNFNSRNYFIDRKKSKYSESQNLYSPYADNHVNALKTTESLTANSLSELLQIFKYVTTPNPIQRLSEINSFQSRRTFRYTKPTETPRSKHFTTFRYTNPARSEGSTEPTAVNVDVVGLENPLKVINDSVADTNSLDGYLFSDSEAAEEYTNPEVRPNIIKIDEKQAAVLRTSKQKKKSAMDEDAVQRGDIAPPLVIETKGKEDRALDAYLIHQGHSRVKIFGSNSNQRGKLDITTPESKITTLDHILMVPDSSIQYTVTLPPPTTTPAPPKIVTKRHSRRVSKQTDSNEFRDRIDLNNQIVVTKNISKWTQDANSKNEKDLQNSQRNDKNIYGPSPFRVFSELFTKIFPKESRKEIFPKESRKEIFPKESRKVSQTVLYDPEEMMPSSDLVRTFRETRQNDNEPADGESSDTLISLPFEYFFVKRSKINDNQR